MGARGGRAFGVRRLFSVLLWVDGVHISAPNVSDDDAGCSSNHGEFGIRSDWLNLVRGPRDGVVVH